MMNEEMIAKAKEARSIEELITLAKENGVELNEEDAKMYFEQLNAKKASCPMMSWMQLQVAAVKPRLTEKHIPLLPPDANALQENS